MRLEGIGTNMDIMKLLLIGAGGYVLYNVFNHAANPVHAVDPATVVGVGSSVPGFKARLVIEATKNDPSRQTFTADEWSWFYLKSYGMPGPDPDNMNLPARGLLMTIDEYVNRVAPLKPVGLSGVNTVASASGRELMFMREVN